MENSSHQITSDVSRRSMMGLMSGGALSGIMSQWSRAAEIGTGPTGKAKAVILIFNGGVLWILMI